MSEAEEKVLAFLRSVHSSDTYWPFMPIMRATGLSRSEVRKACRALAASRLAVWGRGFTETSSSGSGYRAITRE
jgi:hypothetical protein